MEKKPVVAVVVLNYKGEKDTLVCLESLRDLDTSSSTVEVVLVQVADDQPINDLNFLHAFPKLHIVHTKNLGYSGGNNLGVRYALKHLHAEYLMLLNNDTRVASDLITQLLKGAQSHPYELAVFCPKIYFEKGREFHADSYSSEETGHVIWYAGGIVDTANVYARHKGVDEVDHGQFNSAVETDFGTGCCLFLSAETWKQVGELDSKYFLYLEDLDYSLRLKKKGGKIVFLPQAKVWHMNAGSSGGSGSTTHVYYQTRNRLYLGLKYSKLNTKLALMKETVKKLLHGTKTEKEGLMDFLLFHMGARRGTTR